MADYRHMIPFIKRWEGKWSDDPDDAGGATLSGITLATYRCFYGKDKTKADLKNMTASEWNYIFKTGYWDKMKADYIENQSIAELCVDMSWGSGSKNAIKHIQGALGLEADGIIGPKTLAALNGKDSRAIFNVLWKMRYDWLNKIALKGNNRKFLHGWLRRLSDIKYQE